MNETQKRLDKWLKTAIIHQLKKQEKLLKKIKPLIPFIQEANKNLSTKSIMEKIKEFENDA